jgi:uncharacterized protein (DUF1697 family)
MRYVAFMRAINVGGRAVMKMREVQDIFTVAGGKDVRTFIQSGNVVFDVPQKSASAVFKKIGTGLRARLGEEPGLIFRRIEDLERVVKTAPLRTLEAADDVKLYVTFLSGDPTRRPKFPLVSEREAVEAIAMNHLDVFIVSRRKKNGMYGFPNAVIEKELGVSATTRNWNTVTRIVDFART